ncbi:MAG: YihY/virulence factor BrkB family protein, partial [Phycisphaeraceae bacterium]|nr:YihY/virulence factor BrkB family protein [Phycisphaeraceae bacterium]
MSEQTPARPERAPSATRTLRVAKQVALQIYRTPLPAMAAALAYRTIFGLIPVFVIGLVVLGAFATKEHVTDVVRDLLRYAGLTEIVIEPEAEATDFGAVGAGFLPIVPTEGGAEAQEETKGAAARLDAWVEQLVLNVREVKLVAIGLTGLAMLAYAALSFVVEIERAFNRIYHAPTGRSWPRRVTQYWTMLTLGSVFLVASFYVGGSFTGWVAKIDGGGDQSALVPIAGFAVTVVIST